MSLISFVVDIDWEYPAPTDKVNFGLMMKQLRTTLGSSFLISMALGASNWRVGQSYDIPAIFSACDFVNIMSYDFNGWQSAGPVGHNAPLYSSPQDSGGQVGNNIDAFFNGFLVTAGVEKSKIVMGIPTYGHVFKLSNAANTAVYSAGVPTGTEDYSSICLRINSKQYTSVLDTVQKAAYAFGGTTWVGFDSPASAAFKAQYILDNGFGGAMFWSLDKDDYTGLCGGGASPVISAVFRVLNDGVSFSTAVGSSDI